MQIRVRGEDEWIKDGDDQPRQQQPPIIAKPSTPETQLCLSPVMMVMRKDAHETFLSHI